MNSRPLRIIQVVSSAATSGAERHALTLAHELQKCGHEVHLVCPAGAQLHSEARALGLRAYPLHMRGVGYLHTARFLMRLIRSVRADVVHAHLTRATYLSWIASTLTRTPLVASVHVATHDQIYRRIATRTNRLIAVSNFVRGVLCGRGVPDSYIDVVYNGTDFADLPFPQRNGVLDEFGIAPDRQVVGLVGRVSREKGHLLAIEAMPSVLEESPNAHLLFVGRIEPSFSDEVKSAVASKGIADRVTMTGNRSDVARMFDAMAFSILPSQMEACPLVALESMARSRALIASRVGGLAEIVEDGETGLLVDLEPAAFATSMVYMLREETERRRMGDNARRVIKERYTLTQMVERVEAVYARAVS